MSLIKEWSVLWAIPEAGLTDLGSYLIGGAAAIPHAPTKMVGSAMGHAVKLIYGGYPVYSKLSLHSDRIKLSTKDEFFRKYFIQDSDAVLEVMISDIISIKAPPSFANLSLSITSSPPTTITLKNSIIKIYSTFKTKDIVSVISSKL